MQEVRGERTQRVMIFTPACSLSAGLGLSFLVNCGISEHSLVLQESRILRFNHGLSGIEGKTITSMYCLSVEEGRTHATGHDFHSGLLAFRRARPELPRKLRDLRTLASPAGVSHPPFQSWAIWNRRENNYFYVLFECGRGENARNEL
ncbi:hypothetical protein BC359_15610 [Priestia flexa]|nr:hypothetical protein BC359_15610 [Priestia flexa]